MVLKKRYRWIVLLSQSTGPEALEKHMDDLRNFVTSQGGEIESMANAGMKPLAYKIRNNVTAHFVSSYISLPHDLNLQNSLQIIQRKSSYLSDVLRQILLSTEHKEDFSSLLEQHKGFSQR